MLRARYSGASGEADATPDDAQEDARSADRSVLWIVVTLLTAESLLLLLGFLRA